MRVVWTASARRDLEAIWSWLAQDNPAAADRVDEDILVAGESLAAMPRRGRTGRLAGTRELIVTGRPYLLVYVVRDEGVAILRIIHMARDWPGARPRQP